MIQIAAYSASLPMVWNVPRDNPNFVGRKELLNNIFTNLQNDPMHTVVLSGPQGFGKSQSAKHYAHQHFEEYDVVWWFRANQYLNQQFEKFALEIAPRLGLDIANSIHTMAPERLVSIIKESIRQKNLKCLIIFDDAQFYKDIEPYILFSHRNTIHTLITTKNAAFSERSLQIQPFKRKESIKYIHIFLPHEPQETKETLANHLGDCPVALSVAVDYIKNYPGMSINRYIVRYKDAQMRENRPSSFMPTTSKKLGGSMDDYEKDLLIAIKMNLSEIQKNQTAFHLLALFSLLHRDEIPVTLVESFLQNRKSKDDLKELMELINQFSFIDITAAKDKKGAYMSMQELVQQIVNSLIPVTTKKGLINEGVKLLEPSFTLNADQNMRAILEDNNPLLHAIKLSQEANSIDLHNQALSSLRVRLNRLLIGRIRDTERAKEINQHLEKDFDNQIQLLPEDELLYNIDQHLLHRIGSHFDKATIYGEKALKLSDVQEGMYEEKLRLISNLIQHHGLVGLLDDCQPLIDRGEKLMPLAYSQSSNAHFIYALSYLFTERGEFSKAIELVDQNKSCLAEQKSHPFIHFFLRLQFIETLLRKGDIKRAKDMLASTAKLLRNYYEKEDNHFFGKLFVLEAAAKIEEPNSFIEAKSLFQKGIKIYEKAYKGPDNHRHQSYAHLQLGKLFHQNQFYKEAKVQYLKAEIILKKLCKNLKVDEVSKLYKQLAILGVDAKDEVLTHEYVKKHVALFDLNHPSTKEIMVYLNEKGLIIPF